MFNDLDDRTTFGLSTQPTEEQPVAPETLGVAEELDFSGPVSLPGQPTTALPGSEEKIRILTERASRGEALFHPLDRPGRQVPAKPALPAEAG